MVQGKLPKGKDAATWFSRKSFFAEGKLQNNVSFSRKNVLRGLHAEPWDKYISVADEGKVLGTWVDLREGETFGNTYQTVIDASKGIFVPRGVANGFQVLSDKVSYSYLVNDYWALELKPKYAFVNYADPSLRYPSGKTWKKQKSQKQTRITHCSKTLNPSNQKICKNIALETIKKIII